MYGNSFDNSVADSIARHASFLAMAAQPAAQSAPFLADPPADDKAASLSDRKVCSLADPRPNRPAEPEPTPKSTVDASTCPT